MKEYFELKELNITLDKTVDFLKEKKWIIVDNSDFLISQNFSSSQTKVFNLLLEFQSTVSITMHIFSMLL